MVVRKKSAKKALSDPETVNQDEEEEETLTEVEYEEEADDLSVVLADLGGEENSQLNVSRINDKSKKKEFVGTFDPDSFSLDMLQDNYGGGEYVILGRKKNRICFNRRVFIAEPIKKTVTQNDGVSSVAAVIADGFKQQNDQMSKLMMMMLGLDRNQSAGIDSDTVRSSILQDMQLMKSIMGGGGSGEGFGAVQIVELLKTGMDIGRDQSGETGPLDLLAKSLETFGKPVAEALALEAKKKEAQKRQMIRKKKQQGHAPASPEPAKPETKGDNLMQQHISLLVQQAQQNSDPGIWAELILDQMGLDEVQAFLGQADPIGVLAEIDPGVRLYQAWFESLRAELLAILAEELSDPDVPDDTTTASETPPLEGQLETGNDP